MLLYLAAALAAQAQPIDATPGQMTLGELQTICSGREPREACRFYVLGVMEGTSLGSGVAKDRDHFCTPEGVTDTEIVAIVKRLAAAELAAFPEDAALPAVSFIGGVLTKTYRCNSH